jgi:hypothetical protein
MLLELPGTSYSFVEYAVIVVDTIYCYTVQRRADVRMPACTACTAVYSSVADVQMPQFL